MAHLPNICAQDHVETDDRIERFMNRAAQMLAYGYTDEECVRVLQADGATIYEAANAMRAGAILNKASEGQ